MLHEDATALVRHPRREDLEAGWIEAMCEAKPGYAQGSCPEDDRLFETLATMEDVAQRWGTDVMTARRVVTLRIPSTFPSEIYATLSGGLMISLQGLLDVERWYPGVRQGRCQEVISELEQQLRDDQQSFCELSGEDVPELDRDGHPILATEWQHAMV